MKGRYPEVLVVCSRCGAAVSPGAAFCGSCGKALNSVVIAPVIARPTIVSILAALHFTAAAIWLPIGLVGLVATALNGSSAGSNVSLVAFFAAAGVGIYQLVCGIGLWKLQRYGWLMQLIAAIVGLLLIPIGTVIAVAILIYLNKPGIKILFSGREASTLTPEEIAHVSSITSGGAGIAVAIIVCMVVGIGLIGVIAAIAIPGLLRARMAANEASAIGALRAISSAEAAYAVANRGYYDSIACLAEPAPCLPTHPGAAFLAENYIRKNGYVFDYLPGPTPSNVPSGSSRTSVDRFVVLATPVSPTTGTRRFCLDHSGDIRYATDPSRAESDECPATWRKIE